MGYSEDLVDVLNLLGIGCGQGVYLIDEFVDSIDILAHRFLVILLCVHELFAKVYHIGGALVLMMLLQLLPGFPCRRSSRNQSCLRVPQGKEYLCKGLLILRFIVICDFRSSLEILVETALHQDIPHVDGPYRIVLSIELRYRALAYLDFCWRSCCSRGRCWPWHRRARACVCSVRSHFDFVCLLVYSVNVCL